MKVTDDLFQLIKSLDQSEKRYFKIFATMHIKGEDNNKYVKLFDAIDSQETYNEALIRKTFPKEKFLNQLHVAKNYLYNTILKSLRIYYSEKSKLNELMDLLKDVQILYDKSLIKQCRKHLDKAKKIAYAYEKHAQILVILDWEKTLARTSAYSDVEERDLLEYYYEHNKATENLNNINEYWKLTMNYFFLRKKQGNVRDKDELKKFNEIIKHPLLLSEDKATSYISKSLYFNIKGLYYHTNKDYKNLLLYSSKLVNLFEANPLLKKEDNFIAALNNLLIVQIELKKYDEAIETLNKLRNIETRSPVTQARIFVTSYDTELNLYLRKGDFEKGILLVKDIEEGLKKFKNKLNKESEALFDYNIAYLYFGLNDFDNSLKWINNIINDADLNIREDIQCFARILNLLIHYELSNFDLIEYNIKSTRRYLSNKNNLKKFELLVLNYLRKLIASKTDSDKTYIFKSWKKELSFDSDDLIEIKAFEYFDFISWLESKITNKNFQEIVKKK
ncbi:MAG TPA: hypothetical protein PKD83_04315 [Ignavibacteria bacterium]|nr:hypothetical protein [Ignavibacteria bacterium]